MFTVGFPVHLSGYYKRRAIEQGLTVVDVPERPAPLACGCKARFPVAVLVPAGDSKRVRCAHAGYPPGFPRSPRPVVWIQTEPDVTMKR